MNNYFWAKWLSSLRQAYRFKHTMSMISVLSGLQVCDSCAMSQCSHLISVKSSSQCSSAPFCPKQEHLIPLSAGTAHEPAARSSVCQCAADLFQLEHHSFLFQSEICTCMLDCAPLVFWLVFSPPALIICLTLAFQDCLSPKVMCVDWRISSKLKCDWCSVARRNSSAKCRWASLQLYAWSQAYTQVHTFSILHV